MAPSSHPSRSRHLHAVSASGDGPPLGSVAPVPTHWSANALEHLAVEVGGAEALDALHADPLPDEPFDWSTVEDRDHEFVAEVLTLLDAWCAELRLDHEFRTIARRILARLTARDQRPMRRSSNRRRFAAGLLWLAGRANGEFCRSGRWSAELLWYVADVSSCSERGWSIRTAAGLITESFPPGWAPINGGPTLGDPTLLHSRTRALLIRRRDALRALVPVAPWRLLPDGQRAEVRAVPTRVAAVQRGTVAGTERANVLVGLGDGLDDATFYALSVPDAWDLIERLEVALSGPVA